MLDRQMLTRVASIQKRAGIIGGALKGAGRLVGGYVKHVPWRLGKALVGKSVQGAKDLVAPGTSPVGRLFALGSVALPMAAAKEVVPPLATAPVWTPYNILKTKFGKQAIPRIGGL